MSKKQLIINDAAAAIPENNHKNIQKLVIDAVNRIMDGNPIRIKREARLIFKNIAKEAGISTTELYRHFGEVMTYVATLKEKNTKGIYTLHAKDTREKCLNAIDRIIRKEPIIIHYNAKLNVRNVAREAGIDDSYIYRAFPDIVREVAKQQEKHEVFGNKETNTKLMEALHRLVASGRRVSVKGVCNEANMRSQFDVVVRKSYPDVHSAILDAMADQKKKTRTGEREALLAALERLRNGRPLHTTPIPLGGLLSVKKLMHESGVHESTICRHHRVISEECLSTRRLETEHVWFFGDNELQLRGGSDAVKLNFNGMIFDWITESAKKFIKACYPTRASSTLIGNISAIRMFAESVYDVDPHCKPENIDRRFMEKLFFSWANSGIKEVSVKRRMSSIRQYLEWCEDTNTVQFGGIRLIRDSDYPKHIEKTPKFIPEIVMSQLNANIDGLHPHVMRFFLVLQDVGMRVSECCALAYDCIFSDAQGDYFIKYFQYKLKKDHVVPVSAELITVIKEQQKEVAIEFPEGVDLLFPTPKYQNDGRKYARAGKAWSKATLMGNLNALAKKRNIVSECGTVYHFAFHMFRHTVATRMINNGVAQHIVQRYLGHESPSMTSTYAHIMDKTLKEEYAKFKGQMIDIDGNIYNAENVAQQLSDGSNPDSIDAQWLKKSIAIQTLPNGLCSLPVVQGSCPHANACLTCPNFRTDHRYLPQHKEQLARTNEIIATCSKNGWGRQLEMNEKIKQSLINIIEPLEAN